MKWQQYISVFGWLPLMENHACSIQVILAEWTKMVGLQLWAKEGAFQAG